MDVPDVSFKVELEDFEAKRGALLPVGSEGGIRDGEKTFSFTKFCLKVFGGTGEVVVFT